MERATPEDAATFDLAVMLWASTDEAMDLWWTRQQTKQQG